MKDIEKFKKVFKENLVKIASKLNKKIDNISRDKYLEEVRKLDLPRVNLHEMGGYRNVVNEIDEKQVDSTFVDYENIFKTSLLEVGKLLKKNVTYVTRDEYINTSRENDLEVLTKHRLKEMGGYVTLKNTLFKDEIEKETKKTYILNEFKDYVIENTTIPTFNDFKKICEIKNIYNSIEEIEDEAREIFPEIDDYLFNESSFTPKYRKELEQTMRKHKRFVITTAVSGKKVNKQFLESLINYSESKNAMVLIMPCEDVYNRKKAHSWNLDPLLKKFNVVFNDLYLNENIYLSSIKVSAKQINPQRGLPQFTQDGSVIIASPKQDLEYVANSNNKIPNASMTTGAITENDYSNDAYMSHRLNRIAEYEHIMGAIIVEVVDNKIFHFRQIQAGPQGEIIDLGVRYSADGAIEQVSSDGKTIVLGDSHFGEHDTNVLEVEKQIIKTLKPDNLVLHDIFSAQSITHHDENKLITKAKKSIKGNITLEYEANEVAKFLDEISVLVKGEVVIVDSNHHEHLDRYLEEGRYATDTSNTYYSLDIVKAMIEGQMPFKYMMMNKTNLKNKKNLVWLEADDDKEFYGIEISQHGHRGANGARGNLTTYRKAYKMSVSGHTHSPKIYKGAWSVGTSSRLRLSYNKGLSSWVHSICIMYENGTRQLINIIKNDNTNKYGWRL